MSVDVEIVREASPQIVAAIGRLLPQLSASAPPPDRAALDRLVRCETNTVPVAHASGAVVGTLTLLLLPVPTGLRARIKDVVVDAEDPGGRRPDRRPHLPAGPCRREPAVRAPRLSRP
ncbi:hypothetical protein [Streptomyces sp. NPDC047985]|uniref:hypothetical protein n=1 Tax=unclassified Streptomyces TaxID=2593676 RepID=UPI00343A9BDE